MTGEAGVGAMVSEELLLPLEGDGGCMAKLPAQALEQLLAGMDWGPGERVAVGLEHGDDAGVYLLDESQGLILTTDFFPPFCRNPYRFGEIAAVNALSDVYAMGGVPLAALNITIFPAQGIPLGALRQILEGGVSSARRAGIPVIGGHSITGTTPVYGMAVLGRIEPQRVVRNDQLQLGKDLVLTKPLGVGVALAAERIGLVPEATMRDAHASMLQLNDRASQLMQEFGCTAGTDVTGFSLAGHAFRMARASGVTVRLHSKALPALGGVRELVEMGCIPGASFRNAEYMGTQWRVAAGVPPWLITLATDPQTSGGLLMAVEPGLSDSLVQRLRAVGCEHATVVGHTEPLGDVSLVLE